MQRSEEISDKKPSVGVVGAGYWGKNLVRNFYELGVLRVVCDMNPEVLTGVRKKYAVETTQRMDDLLSNSAIDAVVIAAPAARHYQLVKESLRARKDVFVEKPLALRTAEAQELVMLARERGRILMVGHILQYHPAIIELKRLISEGDLGKIQYIYSSRLNLGKLRTEENILWSFAPHDIAAILYLLGETPEQVATHGGSFLNPPLVDTTLTSCTFKAGVKAHIFVSWLHPFKEQKLTIVADKRMAVFDDLEAERKLVLYSHRINWVDRVPVAQKDEGEVVPIATAEPLRVECEHFLECIRTRQRPRTDGESAVSVLQILDACERSLDEAGKPVAVNLHTASYQAHPTAIVDQPCDIGQGTKIWHFSHVMSGAVLGKGCNLGQNVMVSSGVRIGNNVKIQNNVSVYTGVELEDDVFCGPSMVFTNVINPRSHVVRKSEYKKTLVRRGATLGANSTIVCGITIGKYAFVGAGAVVTRDVPDYALVVGMPAKRSGWMCSCGVRLPEGPETTCSACGRAYSVRGDEGKETLKESEESLKTSLTGAQ
jgi:UDP-2-acetamido-3-amino-2,3-dideoxy-glucuronate N-acetyltransferase